MSEVMEPRVVVFEDEDGAGAVLCAEEQSIMKVPSTELIRHLMAAYYVFGSAYPRQ